MPQRSAMKRVNVLVAEDSEEHRFLVESYCQGTEFEPTFAEDGQQAVDAYRSGTFQIIIMDLHMPGMDGLIATRLIRGIEGGQRSKRIPILALTADVLPAQAAEAHQAGCDLHLPKPISKRRLLHELESWKPLSSPLETAADIEVAPGREHLALSYLIARQREVPLLHDLTRRADFDEVRRLAKRLVDTGASYGFLEIARLGAGIERAGLGHDTGDLKRHINELSMFLESAARQVRTRC